MNSLPISKETEPTAFSRQQFTLAQLLLWVTYIAIGAAVWRMNDWAALIFLGWIVPGISRYQAIMRNCEPRPPLRSRIAPLLGCILLEVALSFMSLVLSLLAGGVLALVFEILAHAAGRQYAQPVAIVYLLTVLGIYVATHLTLRHITWHDKMKW